MSKERDVELEDGTYIEMTNTEVYIADPDGNDITLDKDSALELAAEITKFYEP